MNSNEGVAYGSAILATGCAIEAIRFQQMLNEPAPEIPDAPMPRKPLRGLGMIENQPVSMFALNQQGQDTEAQNKLNETWKKRLKSARSMRNFYISTGVVTVFLACLYVLNNKTEKPS